jgi:dephospho-CoA kinase
MLKVGVTGGIGSGKSTVCKIFSVLGVPVFNADIEAREIMNSSEEVKQALITIFGETIYNNEGLDRKKLAAGIFNNAGQLEKVNALVHPKVHRKYEEWLNEVVGSKYVVYEAALIIESGFHKKLDVVIMVDAPEKLRIERIRKRDSSSDEDIRKRMKNQLPIEKKKALSHYIINNGEKDMLMPQVLNLHKEFTN